MGREALEAELLDVQDDLGDVLLDAGDRRELLVDVRGSGSRDRRALERGQQHAPQRVAEGDAVAGLKGPASYLAYVPASSTGSICGLSSSIMRGGYLE